MNDTIDVDKTIEYIELGLAAQGTIEAGPNQQERLSEITERVGCGDYHTEIDWDQEFIKMLLARCVDGRLTESGDKPLAPNAAGGTETIFVADDLTTKRYVAEDGSTAGGYKNLVKALITEGYAVGGHSDEHVNDEKSGCGANDKLAAIYHYMAENSEVLKELAEQILGTPITAEDHGTIIGNANVRSEFSNGKELLAILTKQTTEANRGDEFTDALVSGHNEVVAAVNKRVGTTLDRDALAAEFGPEYQAFNVDAWAFEEAARATSLNEDEVRQKVIAMAYYNLATTMVLAGPKMRVVILD